jgi:hypothetical protein
MYPRVCLTGKFKEFIFSPKWLEECTVCVIEVHHERNNYKDIKPSMSSLLVFNRVYRLEIQSCHVGIFGYLGLESVSYFVHGGP